MQKYLETNCSLAASVRISLIIFIESTTTIVYDYEWWFRAGVHTAVTQGEVL